MSSHREAPEISKDPVADNADTYAFVSPDKPDTVTIITNYVPLQAPPGRPELLRVRRRRPLLDLHRQRRRRAAGDHLPVQLQDADLRNPNTFLYNTGPISSLSDPNWNKRQFYTVTRMRGRRRRRCSARGFPARRATSDRARRRTTRRSPPPPCRRSSSGEVVFAGQRNDPFFVDLGSIFDLGDLRPFQNLHLIPTAAAPGVDATKALNIHTIAIQVPISDLTADGSVPSDPMSAEVGARDLGRARAAARCGSPTAANDELSEAGPWVQVSRLGNPLFNEVLVPLGRKDRWNASQPVDDEDFADGVKHPELAGLLPGALPGRVPEPRGAERRPRRPRGDPAHRHPGRDRPGLPEQHRLGARRHAAAERGDPADVEPEPARSDRRRPRRLPERPPRRRRRRHDRAAGDRRRHLSAGRQELQARTARRRWSPRA